MYAIPISYTPGTDAHRSVASNILINHEDLRTLPTCFIYGYFNLSSPNRFYIIASV